MSNKAKSTATVFWNLVNTKKEVKAPVTMTPAQFRNMLTQAVEYGYNQGVRDGGNSSEDFMPFFCDIMRRGEDE